MAGRDYQAALPNITRYTRWEQVPDGLFTKTQLAALDPPRKPAKDAVPQGQVLYHGNSYAPLFALADTVVKRTMSEAQRAVLNKARALQFVCCLCGHQDHEPLGKGRICDACRAVRIIHQRHLDAQDRAKALYDQVLTGAVVLLAVDDPDRIRQLAFVGDGLALTVDLGPDAPPPAEAFAAVANWLDARMSQARTIVCWDRSAQIRNQLRELLVPDLPRPEDLFADSSRSEIVAARDAFDAALIERSRQFGWLAPRSSLSWAEAQETYVNFHAKPSYSPLDPLLYQVDWKVDPRARADTTADRARALDKVLHDVVSGAPGAVHPNAPWLTYPNALSDTASS